MINVYVYSGCGNEIIIFMNIFHMHRGLSLLRLPMYCMGQLDIIHYLRQVNSLQAVFTQCAKLISVNFDYFFLPHMLNEINLMG